MERVSAQEGFILIFSKNIEDHLTYMQDYVVTIIVAFFGNGLIMALLFFVNVTAT